MVSSAKTKTTNLYLPDECWEYVFKFILDEYDVDENYRSVTCSNPFFEKTINLTPITSFSYLEPLSLVSKQFLSITNRLRFSLTINSDLPQPYILRIFQRFTNLTSLDFTHFKGDLNELLSQISRFSIHNFNLKSLKFTKIPENGLRDFSKKITTLTSLTISQIELYNHDLVLIFNCFPFLEELDMLKTITSKNIDVELKAMSTALPKLRKINLPLYFSINNSLILNLCKNCEFLEDVNMLNCSSLTNDGIASAVRERPGLTSLSFILKSTDNISSHFIDSLVSLKGLTCLDLTHSHISDKLLYSIAKEGLALRRLVLQNCSKYSYDGIYCLLSKCQCIQHLDLQYTHFLNDHHVVELSLFLGDLVSINLSHCSMLTDSTLFALARKCPSLSEIIMEDTCIGKESVEDSDSVVSSVVSPQLKCLRLAQNPYLRDGNIIMFSSICPNLQFLDLSYCYRISKGIGEVLRCCKIRHLNLTYCLGLKLRRMNFKVSTLEVLNLSNSKIDDKSLYAISKSFRGLLQLHMGYCHDVTEKGVRKVVEKCTKLREINLEQCREVDASVVKWMIYIRPSLRKIIVPPCFRCSDSERKDFLHHGCLVC